MKRTASRKPAACGSALYRRSDPAAGTMPRPLAVGY